MAPFAIPLFKVFVAEGADAAVREVLHSGQLAGGTRVAAFEAALAAHLQQAEVVALCDASAALTLALALAGVGPGDQVVTSPLACSATLSPVANLFAQPAWCDIDPLTGMPDDDAVAAAITDRTRAILISHWSGDVAEIDSLAALAHHRGIALIEDASEAFGARCRGRPLGGLADFTVFSFYATKPLTTGEGAALLAADPAKRAGARHRRRFGIDSSAFRLANGDLNPLFDIPVAGFNFPMTELAAAIGLAQIDGVDAMVSRHQANGAYFDRALGGVAGLHLLRRRPDSLSGFWTYALRAERRDDLIRKLNSHGIGAQRLHLRNDAFTCFGGRPAELPGVALFDRQNLSIPCGWWVGEEERQTIADCLRSGW